MTPANQPDYWQTAVSRLAAVDPTMGRLALAAAPMTLKSRGAPFTTLVRSVVGQQISVKAADAVWARLLAAIGQTPDTAAVRPEQLLADTSILDAVGLSQRKREYVLGLAAWFADHPRLENTFVQSGDEEVIQLLMGQRGIGRWTAEMFLIFTLMRPDVFPVDDLGILKALDLHYERALKNFRRNLPGDSPAARRARAMALAERWRPYRTVASWLLWRSLDPVPVEY
jgi:DNA-3-methyladenine glycosylase II